MSGNGELVDDEVVDHGEAGVLAIHVDLSQRIASRDRADVFLAELISVLFGKSGASGRGPEDTLCLRLMTVIEYTGRPYCEQSSTKNSGMRRAGSGSCCGGNQIADKSACAEIGKLYFKLIADASHEYSAVLYRKAELSMGASRHGRLGAPVISGATDAHRFHRCRFEQVTKAEWERRRWL